MYIFQKKTSQRLKRFVTDYILEPLMSLEILESYVVFWARCVYFLRKPYIIGITGSVGKSTTTAMVAAVLSHVDAKSIVGKVGCTTSNMNDDLGVSATLLRFDHVLELPWNYFHRALLLCSLPFRALFVALGDYPKVMVLECGVGDTANFRHLVTIAPPNISVVTRIGAAHLQKLGTIEGVIEEKGELVRAVPQTGLVILGQTHEYVDKLEKLSKAPVVRVTGEGAELSKNIAREICKKMRVPEEVVTSTLQYFKNPQGRLNWLKIGNITVIDDTYNANPLSMRLGLDTLAKVNGLETRRLAILGGMGELGEEGIRYHEEIGIYAQSRSDVLIGIGELSKHYRPAIWFEDSETCANQIENLILAGDCILVKGSASARMSLIVSKLKTVKVFDGYSV